MNHLSIERAFFFTLLIAASAAFLGLLQVFVLPVFWAVAFAIIFGHWNQRLTARFSGRRTLASALTVTVIVLLVLVPLLLLGLAVTSELTELMEGIEAGKIDVSAPISWFQERVPLLFDHASRFGLEVTSMRNQASDLALYAGQWVAGNALRIGQNALAFFVGVTLMLYLLFFFLRDGRTVVERLVRILPLGDIRERHLFQRFAEVVRATVKGTFVIAAVQGALGGVAFWALGIGGAVLWGVVMAGASLIPVIGAALVWLPAAIMLMTAGELVKGLILVVVGVVVVGAADNVLRPILVGRDTNMPDYLVLLATLGGLALFGITGLVIGPLIAALFITLWEMFEETYGDRESEHAAAREVSNPDADDHRVS
jgi:predicted PurR-regulated permease PerM